LELVEQIIKNDRFCFETIGMELVEITPGAAKVKLKITPAHLNGLGRVQGGAIFSLADVALAAAANSHGYVAVSINASISYFKAASQGMTLLAEAKAESVNPKLGTYTVRVTDQDGQLIALMQSTVYRKKETVASCLAQQAENRPKRIAFQENPQ
jgi:acyl-CoA thioesterase